MVGSLVAAAFFEAGTFMYAATTFAVNYAVSTIVSRTFSDNPQANNQQDMGVRLQVPPSSVNAIPIVYGDAYMGGTFVDAVLTTDQKTMYYVLAASSISKANATLGTSAGVLDYDQSLMYYGDRLISFSSSGTVQSVTVFNGGTGYAVGNTLTVVGGTSTSTATLTVASVSATGAVLTATVAGAGSYSAAPDNPALVTGGAGTLASFALKFSAYTNTVTALADSAGNVDTKINGNLYINLYKSSNAGTITSVNGASAPSTEMGGSDIAVAQRWTGTRQMNNLAFAIVKLNYSRDAETTQLSPITFKLSHYPNGASVAKPGDVWLDYMVNDVYGGAVDPAFLDATCVSAINTYSDQTITYTPAGGGAAVTQARYRINGVLDAGQTVLANIDRIMTACDSWMTYSAALGQWSIVINKAESTSYAFTDNNIIGDIRVSASDIASSINQVEARFPFKANRDQAAFVNLQTPADLMYPNEPVNKFSITYDLVNDSVQAQYLANRLLEQAREDLIVSFNTTYYGIQVDAGNVISVTNSDYGWVAKLFRVVKVNEASLADGSLGARLEMSEYNAAVYDDQDITQFTPAPNSNLSSVSYFSPLSAPTVTGYPSAAIPNFSVQVYIPVTGRVTFSNLFFTTSAIPAATDWQLLTNASTSNNQPITNNTNYTYTNLTLNTNTYYLAYQVGNEVSTSILSPLSASLAWVPTVSATVADGSITTAKLADSAVTTLKIAASAVTANKTNIAALNAVTGNLNALTVDAAQIMTDAVTNIKIAAAAVTANKTNIAALNAVSGDLNTSTVSAAQLVTDAVTSIKIAASAVTANKTNIAALNAVSGDLNTNTVNAAQLMTDAVTSIKIAAGAVSATKTAIAAINSTSGNLTANSVTAGTIAAGTIVAADIAANTITGNKIAATTIAAGNIAAGAITAGKIAAGTIVADDIAANTITGAKIAATTIAAGNIVANTITSSQIFAGTITATEIAASTITGAKIAATTIAAVNIVSGTITASQIATGTITANEIAAGTITAAKLNVTELSAISANMGTITAGSLAIGTANNIFKVDSSGNIWSGNANYASAPFKVSSAGALTATTGTFAGTITAGTASFDGSTVYSGETSAVIGKTTTGSNLGVFGDSTGGYGVFGRSNSSSGGFFGNLTSFYQAKIASPTYAIDAVGPMTITGQITSTLAIGTPPLSVTSTTEVPNLNAGRLGGILPANFTKASTATTIDIGSLNAGGGATVTQTLTNKPGTATATNTWIEITIGGVLYVMPVWIAN